jgi:hypothetical protein
MKVSGILFAFLFFISMSVSLKAEEKDHRKILGVWEFSAPKAPQPYDNGLLTLKEIDQKLAGEFTIQGQALAIPQIEFMKDTLTLGFEIQSTPIILKLKLTDGVFEGVTESPDGPVTVTAKPAKKETKTN